MALRRTVTALLMAGLVTAQVAQAQVTLNFVNADIDQVARAIGAATGKTIIVDPRVKGQLNLVSENPVPEEQALKTLQSALRMQGFSLVQDHGVLKVVPEADAKLQGVPTYVGNAPTARGDQVITQVFSLHNESANNLLPVLRPLISPNNTIAAYPSNNTLVVTDYADNVRRIAGIIAGIDTAAGRSVDVVHLKNANAIDVAEQLNKLLDPGAVGSNDATLKVTATRRSAHQFADAARLQFGAARRGEATGAEARRADLAAGQHARRHAAQRRRHASRENAARHARQGRRRQRYVQQRIELECVEFVQPVVGSVDGRRRPAAAAGRPVRRFAPRAATRCRAAAARRRTPASRTRTATPAATSRAAA